MFNLEPWGKIHVSKENTKETYAHFPLMHSCFHIPSHCGEQRDVLIIHPSRFQFPSFFFGGACLFHHLDLTKNIVVDSDLSLFYSMHACCAFSDFA